MVKQRIDLNTREHHKKERPAGSQILPGFGLLRQPDGTVIPVDTVEPVNPMARVAAAARLSVGKTIEDPIGAGQNTEYFVFRSGDEIQMRLASGTDLSDDGTVGGAAGAGADQANVTESDPLAFFSDGSVKVAQNRDAAVVEAMNSVDNSGANSGEYAWVEAEVL